MLRRLSNPLPPCQAKRAGSVRCDPLCAVAASFPHRSAVAFRAIALLLPLAESLQARPLTREECRVISAFILGDTESTPIR